ncbi:hypothetical protein J2S75_000632 [Ancylobacter polymorphus]|uniref:Uncharacterized protein n=1 Tax=Ancylobacter polymorphus TaxID=223390 RepID=A0ABU0B720_9HYPH|nr:hypothetical protein [Ancylobacter polymorphus]
MKSITTERKHIAFSVFFVFVLARHRRLPCRLGSRPPRSGPRHARSRRHDPRPHSARSPVATRIATTSTGYGLICLEVPLFPPARQRRRPCVPADAVAPGECAEPARRCPSHLCPRRSVDGELLLALRRPLACGPQFFASRTIRNVDRRRGSSALQKSAPVGISGVRCRNRCNDSLISPADVRALRASQFARDRHGQAFFTEQGKEQASRLAAT